MKSPSIHLVLSLLILAVVAGGYGMWYHTLTKKSVEGAELEARIRAKTEVSTRASQTRAAFAQISGDEALIQGYFIPETKVVPFINDLEARARAQKAEIKVLSVATAGTVKQGNLALILSLGIDGTFDAVVRTIGTIEHAPYSITVSRLALRKSAKGAWHADLELSVGSVSVAPATGQAAKP